LQICLHPCPCLSVIYYDFDFDFDSRLRRTSALRITLTKAKSELRYLPLISSIAFHCLIVVAPLKYFKRPEAIVSSDFIIFTGMSNRSKASSRKTLTVIIWGDDGPLTSYRYGAGGLFVQGKLESTNLSHAHRTRKRVEDPPGSKDADSLSHLEDKGPVLFGESEMDDPFEPLFE
jgi:hypothetical protein